MPFITLLLIFQVRLGYTAPLNASPDQELWSQLVQARWQLLQRVALALKGYSAFEAFLKVAQKELEAFPVHRNFDSSRIQTEKSVSSAATQ